jgi:hypothetical protein
LSTDKLFLRVERYSATATDKKRPSQTIPPIGSLVLNQ